MLVCVLSNFNSSTPAILKHPLYTTLGVHMDFFGFSQPYRHMVQERFVADCKLIFHSGTRQKKVHSSGLARYQLESETAYRPSPLS